METQLELPKIDIKDILSKHLPLINEVLEKWIPRAIHSEEELVSLVGKQRYSCDIEALNKTLFQPIWNILDRGGKRWRSSLLLLIAETLGKPIEDVLDFVVITEVIHNGTLIADDIEDDSEYRRGQKCLHLIYGIDVALNAGNFMYFLPLRVLHHHQHNLDPQVLIQCYQIYANEMTNLHIGQGLDLCWHSKTNIIEKEPSVDNYLQMCSNKTGGLARMSAKLSALICGGTPSQIEAFGRFAETMGVAFQIKDDLLNLEEVSELSIGKGGVGEDIHEGKRTIMVLHALKNAQPEEAKRLKEILAMKTTDSVLIKEAIDILKKNNSMEFAHQKAKELMEEAWREIDTVLPNTLAKAKLKALVDFLIQRTI